MFFSTQIHKTMGVLGLWRLLDPMGTPVPVETLEGKVLAIGTMVFQNSFYTSRKR